MAPPFNKLDKTIDVTTWVNNNRLSFSDVCKKFDLDVSSDVRHKFLHDIISSVNKARITEEQLGWCGYNTRNKREKFLSLVKKHPLLAVSVTDVDNTFYIEMNEEHFGFLLMEMRKLKAVEFCQLYWFFKLIWIQYLKYEISFEERLQRNATEAKILKTRRISNEVIDPLRNVVSPLVAPPSTSPKNQRYFALINLDPAIGKKWYITRCQQRNYGRAINNITEQHENAVVVHLWRDVSHSIDLGNLLKQHLSVTNNWRIDSNILEQINEGDGLFQDNDLVNVIQELLNNNPVEAITQQAEIINEQ